MDAYWHPVCPDCREEVTSVAFPGDERGPLRPEQYPLLSNVFCSNLACRRIVAIETCSLWQQEKVWTGRRPFDLLLTTELQGLFSY